MRSKKTFIIIFLIILIAIPSGWYLYEKKKESDRQDLIHMGDDLKKAMGDYDKTVKEINENKSLALEYTKLMESIIDGNVSSEDLNKTKETVCEMEEKLMTIYPTVYSEPSSVCK